jgi:hypothetical protein
VILYTVIPEEFVLAGLGADGAPAAGVGFSLEMFAAGGSGPVRLLLERDPGGRCRVSRLVSSDPFDFLNPAFAPGRVIERPGE